MITHISSTLEREHSRLIFNVEWAVSPRSRVMIRTHISNIPSLFAVFLGRILKTAFVSPYSVLNSNKQKAGQSSHPVSTAVMEIAKKVPREVGNQAEP